MAGFFPSFLSAADDWSTAINIRLTTMNVKQKQTQTKPKKKRRNCQNESISLDLLRFRIGHFWTIDDQNKMTLIVWSSHISHVSLSLWVNAFPIETSMTLVGASKSTWKKKSDAFETKTNIKGTIRNRHFEMFDKLLVYFHLLNWKDERRKVTTTTATVTSHEKNSKHQALRLILVTKNLSSNFEKSFVCVFVNASALQHINLCSEPNNYLLDNARFLHFVVRFETKSIRIPSVPSKQTIHATHFFPEAEFGNEIIWTSRVQSAIVFQTLEIVQTKLSFAFTFHQVSSFHL